MVDVVPRPAMWVVVSSFTTDSAAPLVVPAGPRKRSAGTTTIGHAAYCAVVRGGRGSCFCAACAGLVADIVRRRRARAQGAGLASKSSEVQRSLGAGAQA